MDHVRPDAHWPGAVQPLLEAVQPREVWVPGGDRLSELARTYAARPAGAPGADTDAVVISGDPNYHVTESCLTLTLAPDAGGEQGPPVIVVSATGWPHGDRDGYLDPEQVPQARRRAYARCLPDPDEVWLTAESAPLAYALESGGQANGVLPAVERVLERGGWRALFLDGFGGLAILAPESRLQAGNRLSAVWDRLGCARGELLRESDRELGRARLAVARLERALAEQQASNRELRVDLAAALDELDDGLDAETQTIGNLADSLSRVNAAILGPARRAQMLEHRLIETEALSAARQRELDDERTWVAAQARGVAASQAWRLGHRLSRTARRLTMRRDRGTDAVQRIIARMERTQRPGGS